jgi:hypothetical protein
MSFAVSVGRFSFDKAAVKMHTLLDLRGPIPSFIHISGGKMGDALALDLITPDAKRFFRGHRIRHHLVGVGPIAHPVESLWHH